MTNIKEGDDVYFGSGADEEWGIVMDISAPFKSGNYTERDGTPILGREVTVFVPEEE